MDSPDIRITEVKIRFLDQPDKGLVAWASCVVNDFLFLNSIGIRKNRHGRIILCFPRRRSGTEQMYYYFKPISRKGTQVLREAVIGKYFSEKPKREQ